MQPPGTAEHPAEQEQNNLKSTANPLAAGTLGFTAALWPAGDIDVFAFDITSAGSSVTIGTSDGLGGCPAGAKTYLRVYDASNAVIVSDQGTTGCVALTPLEFPGLASLPPGPYIVKVESGDGDPIPFYVLDINIALPGCGDGLVQVGGGEQCDDQNTLSGDGCAADCVIEGGSYLDEIEVNDTQATGNLLDGYDGVVGQIGLASDLDWYTLTVTVPGSSIVAQVGDGFGSCPAGFDSKLSLYSPSLALLTSDDNGGVGGCSKISPSTLVAASNLPAGVYGLKVEEYGNNATTPFYVLTASVLPPGCGDGIRQIGEQCDDQNTAAGDGCSPTCQFEKSYATEVEPNDTQALANVLPPGGEGFVAGILPAGDFDYFSFDVVTAGSSVTIHVFDGLGACPTGFDSKITLYDPASNPIVTNDDGLYSPCSSVRPSDDAAATNLTPGTYKVRVERYGNNLTQAQYVVSIKVSEPGCGDGILQSGEQCDDNNAVTGDGCSATCTAEAPYEIEPNGSTATATPQWPATTSWKGSIAPLGDHDYYSFTLATIGSPTLTTHNVNDAGSCSFDSVIHLLRSDGTQIVEDDDGYTFGSCSQIDPIADPAVKNLPPGTYYVWVQRFNDTDTIPAYQLDLSVP